MSCILTEAKAVNPMFGEGFAFTLVQDGKLLKEFIYLVGSHSLPLQKEGVARDVIPCASVEEAERYARQQIAFILANDCGIQQEPLAA